MLLKIAFVCGVCLLWRAQWTAAEGGPFDEDLFRISAFQQAQRDREPLSPDYKDPIARGSSQTPVLQPKPHKTPSTTFNPVIPGGIIDVDAAGFDHVPNLEPFGDGLSDSAPEFDLPNFNFHTKPGLLSFGGFFGVDSLQWWKGPNVCIEREESTDDEDGESTIEKEDKSNSSEVESSPPNFFSTSIRLSNCQETPSKYECITKINNHGVVKTFTVRYKCCYGFKRQQGATGCSKQIDLKPLLDTLDTLNLKEFTDLIKTSGIESQFTNGNYTIFAPTDDALNNYNERMSETNNVDAATRRRELKNTLSSKDLVLSHAVAGFVDLTDLGNEEIIYSENNNSSIRINIYPTQSYERMVTVNCARVTKANNLAKNGIVHITDGIVLPATQTIREIVDAHPRLTNLKRVLDNSDVYTHMKESGHYTLFAATDDAFNKLDKTEVAKLSNGGECASRILKHHITAHTVCSSAVIGNATTHNVEGDVLNLERTADDEVIFEGKSKIIETDIIASNGVIHLINTLILPDSALYIGNVLKTENLTKFQEIIERAGLTDEVNNLNNATVFAPSNEAFDKPETQKLLQDIGDDTEGLRQLVWHHTVQGQIQTCDMNNNEQLQTNDNNKSKLRLNLYSTLPLFTNVVNRATINCARITGFDEKACGSVVHEVDKVLLPPTKNILEMLVEDPKYSTLVEIIKGTEVENILKDANASITFLAPTDETFAAVDDEYKKRLLEDKNNASHVLKNHILTEVLCCSGVGPHTWGFNNVVPTMSQQHVEVGRIGSKIRINRAVVTSCDNLATNGVLHTINKVLIPQRPVSTYGGGFILFDL